MERLDVLHPSIDEYLLEVIPERDEVLRGALVPGTMQNWS